MSSVVDEIREEVEEEALARGRMEGREEGRVENQIATVRQLLKMGGFSQESIAEITRLSLEEVRAIAAKEGR